MAQRLEVRICCIAFPEPFMFSESRKVQRLKKKTFTILQIISHFSSLLCLGKSNSNLKILPFCTTDCVLKSFNNKNTLLHNAVYDNYLSCMPRYLLHFSFYMRLPLWSSGQRSWQQILRSLARFRRYKIF
jgi:hypothetical protein